MENNTIYLIGNNCHGAEHLLWLSIAIILGTGNNVIPVDLVDLREVSTTRLGMKAGIDYKTLDEMAPKLLNPVGLAIITKAKGYTGPIHLHWKKPKK